MGLTGRVVAIVAHPHAQLIDTPCRSSVAMVALTFAVPTIMIIIFIVLAPMVEA